MKNIRVTIRSFLACSSLVFSIYSNTTELPKPSTTSTSTRFKVVSGILGARTLKPLIPNSAVAWAHNQLVNLNPNELANLCHAVNLADFKNLVEAHPDLVPTIVSGLAPVMNVINPWKIKHLITLYPETAHSIVAQIVTTDCNDTTLEQTMAILADSYDEAHNDMLNVAINYEFSLPLALFDKISKAQHSNPKILLQYLEKNTHQQTSMSTFNYLLTTLPEERGRIINILLSNIHALCQNKADLTTFIALYAQDNDIFGPFIKKLALSVPPHLLSVLDKKTVIYPCYKQLLGILLEASTNNTEDSTNLLHNLKFYLELLLTHQQSCIENDINELCTLILVHNHMPILEALLTSCAKKTIDTLLAHHAQKPLPVAILKKILPYAAPEHQNALKTSISDQIAMVNSSALKAITNQYLDEKNASVDQASLTQTGGHVAKNMTKIAAEFGEQILSDTKLIETIEAMLAKEEIEQQNGNHTFFHAQQWHWHLLADIFKQLWQVTYQEEVNDYQFLRFLNKPSTIELLTAHAKRAIMLTLGRTLGNRPDLLFMNHSLFGNSTNHGSCSFAYFLRNHDMSNISITIRQLCVLFGLESWYDAHQQEFEALIKIHQSANKRGNMLLLSFTPEQLKQSVYVAAPGGAKRTVKIYGEEITDVATILAALKDHPDAIENSDAIEYCATLTQDSMLHPQHGPRIYSFNTADKTIMQEYTAHKEQLFSMLQPNMATPPSLVAKACKPFAQLGSQIIRKISNGAKELISTTKDVCLDHIKRPGKLINTCLDVGIFAANMFTLKEILEKADVNIKKYYMSALGLGLIASIKTETDTRLAYRSPIKFWMYGIKNFTGLCGIYNLYHAWQKKGA